MKIYCKDCGSPTDFTINKPKFCSNCGKSFLNVNNVSQSKGNNLKLKTIDTEDEQDDNYQEDSSTLDSFNDIKNLDFEVSVQKNSKQTIGDLIGTSTESDQSSMVDIPQKKLSRKEFLEQFSKEAGSLRGKNKSRKRDA